MKYKNIKSVAHNFAHSFASTLNWFGGDYVVAHLARAAAVTGERAVRIDLLTGAVSPASLDISPLRETLPGRIGWLPTLLRGQNVDPDAIVRAVMTVSFDPSTLPAPERARSSFDVAYRCVVEMTDDRGKTHAGVVEDRWRTEAHPGTLPISTGPFRPPGEERRPLFRRLFSRRG